MKNESLKMNIDWRQHDIRWIAVAASLVLSSFTLIMQELPNSDAYTYARTSEIFLANGVIAAYQHYSWATYSILIGIVSSTGLDVFSAGLFVNSIFYAILVYAFLSIIKEMNDSKPLLAIAAVCILVYPQLNEYRELLIRDIGFWALSLAALWQYLIYVKAQSLHSIIISCSCLILAASFRAEALAYLAFTPLALLFDTRLKISARKALLIKMYAVVISLSTCLLIFLALMGLNAAQLFIEFTSIYEPFISGNFTLNDGERALLGSLLFTEYAATFSREYIEVFLLAGMISILLVNLLTGISGPYLIILTIGLFKNQLRVNREIGIPIVFYLCINFLILISFIIVTRYLSSRYAMLMCILLVLFVPGVVLNILENAKASGRKSVPYIIAIFFSYCAIDSYFSFGESKSYVKDTIEWIAENTEGSAGLVTNNHAVAYFSGKVDDYDLVKRNLSEKEILSSEIGDTIVAELTFEMKGLLDNKTIAERLNLLAYFPSAGTRRIAVFKRVN